MLCFKEKSHVPLFFIQNYYFFFCFDITFTLLAKDTAFTTKIHLNTCRAHVCVSVCACVLHE